MKANDPSNDLSEQYPNAMVVAHLVSAEGIQPADCYDAIDGKKFNAWMKNRGRSLPSKGSAAASG